MTCQGFVTFIALDSVSATNNPGALRLNAANEPSGAPVFRCVATTALCSITVQGPQNTAPGSANFNETTNVLSVNVNVQATRTGVAACGPDSGTANHTANYSVSPSDLTIDD